ncbi:putative leader peptide [Spirillospora albida]
MSTLRGVNSVPQRSSLRSSTNRARLVRRLHVDLRRQASSLCPPGG